jgi:hypothetical protein
MRHIVHDWPDSLATAILKNIKGSMKPESRLLIRMEEFHLENITVPDPPSLPDDYVLLGPHQHDLSDSTDMIVVRLGCSL